MRLRFVLAALPAICVVPVAAGAQQLTLATGFSGPTYDVVANCLMRQMSPRAVAAPVVRPPPANRAEVHLYPRGGDGVTPVATFYLTQADNGGTVVTYEERPDSRGLYTAAARAAAAQCAR